MKNSTIEKLLTSKYEIRLISSDNNFPKIKLSNNNLIDLCILLHNGISLNDISNYFKWSNKQTNMRIEMLLNEELIKKTDNSNFLPNFPIISLHDGLELFHLSEFFVDKIYNLTLANLAKINYEIEKLSCIDTYDPEKLSLFMFSDILLDAFQIDYIENDFLNSHRTDRNNMNYYIALLEKQKESNKEPFGIYGNMYKKYGENTYCIYGNERYGKTFITMDKKYIEDNFRYSNIQNIDKIKEYLLCQIINCNKKNTELPEKMKDGFRNLGILVNDIMTIPIFNKNDSYIFNQIAKIIRPEYINLFKNNKNKLVEYHNNSKYLDSTSFQEFFIWWYHFFYTSLTDYLVKKEIIILPETINFHYIMHNC